MKIQLNENLFWTKSYSKRDLFSTTQKKDTVISDANKTCFCVFVLAQNDGWTEKIKDKILFFCEKFGITKTHSSNGTFDPLCLLKSGILADFIRREFIILRPYWWQQTLLASNSI